MIRSIIPSRSYALSVVIAASVFICAAPQSHARIGDDGAPAETLGVGENVHATAWGPSALFYNPAGLARKSAYIIEGNYTFLDDRSGHAWTASAMDSKTNQYAALAASYTYISSQPGGVNRDGHQFRGGLATGYKGRDFSLYAGISARYLNLKKTWENGKPGQDLNAWTADIGLLFDIADRIKFGVTGHNLIEVRSEEAPRKLGLGLAFSFETLNVTADMDIDLTGNSDTTFRRWGFGTEYLIQEVMSLRGGLDVNELLRTQRLTVGLGYVSNNYAIDIGYSGSLSGGIQSYFAVSFRYIPTYQP